MYKKFIKRGLDIILSFILTIFLLPLFLVVGIIIKCDDKGPILYVQDRTGKGGKIFKILKFRTMTCETHKNGKPLNHDERLTSVGKFLRKTSIDELPQVINILKGDMSFIGPRPWVPEYFEAFNDAQKKRVDVLPGLTGLAQAVGRNAIDIFKKIDYDLEYVANISFKMDIKVILLTIKTVLKKEGAEIIQEDIYNEINLLRNQATGTYGEQKRA